jgi:hypothetical protein
MRRTRRDPRFLVPRPWEGMLRIPGDVVVEQHDAEQKEMWVVSSEPARREERFTLELTPPGQSLAVRVIESSPVMMGGNVRHRLRLAILD